MTYLELQTALYDLKKELDQLVSTINIDNYIKTKNNLEEKTFQPDFWSDTQLAQSIMSELNDVKSIIDEYNSIIDIYETLELSYELAKEDETYKLDDVEQMIDTYHDKIENLTIHILLNKPYDKFNAFIEFHPGAGGTESQDWAQMLYRMYLRFAEKKGYKVEVIDYQDGDEAGLKSATILVEGLNAYGYLKAESGVHRLVRISPFDSSSRRHTSFASVKVYPETDDSIEVEINDEDLRIDTYRSSGKGGQGVNTTDSAVRITHLPTKIVVTCQNERSQIQNRETAMKVLRSKLYTLELEKKQAEINAFNENKLNAFGSQIRSYVFHPYTMVKDHRTQTETGNGDSVMDGNLDKFILSYLVQLNS
ncbi:MAG: peptide chain release factor 2 [Bacilli bacterium]|nr:peptide chain release factor 2 [Bacilli bacterium]MBN2876043.1 peptide chain release factor 2 [Bacilli bacterium]